MPMLLSFIFFLLFNGPHYLRMYWTDLHKISGQVDILVGMINPTFFLQSLKGCCYGNGFWAQIG